jgi:thiol-disulfide isomerase/thioredoxin
MRGATSQFWVWLVLCSVLAGPSSVRGEGRPTNEILTEIDRIPLPPPLEKEAREDKKVVAERAARLFAALDLREILIRELWKSEPNHERLPKLLGETWSYRRSKATNRRNSSLRVLTKAGADKKRLMEEVSLPWFDDLSDEMDQVIAATTNEKVKIEAVYWKAQLAVESNLRSIAALPAIQEFIRMAPSDERGAGLLYEIGAYCQPDNQADLLTRLIADYPTSSYVPRAELILAKLAGVGRPFELVFNEATTRKRITMDDFLGKVVVIEFWATWCGPCVEEMPKMKTLYERFRGQGVEFIGVSHDRKEGGLNKLRDFVTKNQIPWPQFYQVEGAEKVPSIFQGGNGIPVVWVVDQEGKLYSIHARGKLETMIPELLRKGRGSVEPKG